MATRTWVGGTSGNWGTAANWLEAAVPVSNDDVVIDTGVVNIDDGLDQSAVDLDSLIIGPNYTGIVGVSGTNPLKIGCDKMVINGGAAHHYISSGAAKTIDVLRIVSIGPTGVGEMTIDGTITVLVLEKGLVTAVDGDIATAVVQSSSGVNADASLTLVAAALTTLHQLNGIVIMDAAGTATLATAYVAIGPLQVYAGTLTNLYQYGGTVLWETDDGALTVANVFGGLFDASGDSAEKTITTLNAYTGATVNLDNGMQSIIVTNLNEYGAVVKPAKPPAA